MGAIDRLLRLADAAGLSGLERGLSYGTPGLRVRGKFLAREKDPGTLVMRCPVDEKAILIEAEPMVYFETDHYRGYDAILIRLGEIDDARLMARLETAWLTQAGERLVRKRQSRA